MLHEIINSSRVVVQAIVDMFVKWKCRIQILAFVDAPTLK